MLLKYKIIVLAMLLKVPDLNLEPGTADSSLDV